MGICEEIFEKKLGKIFGNIRGSFWDNTLKNWWKDLEITWWKCTEHFGKHEKFFFSRNSKKLLDFLQNQEKIL